MHGCFLTGLVQANEFRRTYPNLALAGLLTVVGVPSLLLRKPTLLRSLQP